MQNKLEKTLNKIPFLLNTIDGAENTSENVFKELKNIIDYDYALIYYINEDRATLKFSKNYKEDNFIKELPDYVKLNEYSRKYLFSLKSDILNADSTIIKKLNLDIKKSSYIITKLSIREVVYGCMILIKQKENFYNTQDLSIAKTLSSVISYAVKDIELSDICKLQLKALQENIIEKNNAYKKIKEQNEQILEAEKAKSEFFANMSHELRTPLNAIIGFSEALSYKLFGDLTPKQEEYVNDISISSIHLLGMINEILDMTKLEANSMKLILRNINVNVAIQESINVMQPLLNKKNIKLQFKNPKDIDIKADYQKIQQIMYNLLSNAIKYTPDNGKITVNLTENKDYVMISIKDTGIGIDKKYQSKIFDKFVQLDNVFTKTGSSTGLGLTITKELTELHKGKIEVESAINKGSKFTVYLPKNL